MANFISFITAAVLLVGLHNALALPLKDDSLNVVSLVCQASMICACLLSFRLSAR